MTEKPPYRVPLMAEIDALEPNGFVAASTFSGCGGSSLGYRMAGFKLGYANEFIPEARATYEANARPYTVVDGRDIRTVQAADVLTACGVKPGGLDLFDGSPPCASFSTAGKRSEGWGVVRKYSDSKQRTDDLFFEFARLVDGIKPKTFVAENVAGLVRGVAVGYFNDVLELLRSLGYRVGARVLDAQWLGVPQQRMRIIFVGVREDLGLDPAYPEPLDYRYNVGDACPWMTDGATEEHPGVMDGIDISRYAIGAEWDKCAEGQQSDRFFSLIRASRSKPAPTILASHGGESIAGVCHPTEKRKFSIAEVRRLCSFPDDFKLTGTYQQKWERMGRAVPPVMMAAVASAVRDKVLIPYRDLREARKR